MHLKSTRVNIIQVFQLVYFLFDVIKKVKKIMQAENCTEIFMKEKKIDETFLFIVILNLNFRDKYQCKYTVC